MTNCTQVKQYSYNIQSSYNTGNVYPLKMEIYECTLNADGTLNEGTTTVDYKESQLTDQDEVTTSITLDAGAGSYPDLLAVGFQTPIEVEQLNKPLATDATDIDFNQFTANWEPCDGATSYTLRVMPAPAEGNDRESDGSDEMIFSGITGTSYTVTGLESETDYIYDVKAVYGNKESNWSNQIEVTTLDGNTTLQYILEHGEDGKEYTISNDLAVVEIAKNAEYAFLTDGKGNWIRIDATSSEIFQSLRGNDFIMGETLKGTLSGMELNPLFTINAEAEGTVNEVEFEVETYDITGSDIFELKVNQVADVIGYWNDASGSLCANGSAIGKKMPLDYTWGASQNTLEDGKMYTVRSAMIYKKPAERDANSIMPKSDDYQNFICYALSLPDTPTAIGTIYGDDVNGIVNVYNVQGQLIRRNVKAGEATKGLSRGLYIVGNKKVLVK